MGPLETFGNKIVVGWIGSLGFGSARAMDIFGRRRIDRPQKKALSLC